MKRIKFEGVLIIPNSMPIAEACETMENTNEITGFAVDSIEIIWLEDELDDEELEAAYLERRDYEADMMAALRM